MIAAPAPRPLDYMGSSVSPPPRSEASQVLVESEKAIRRGTRFRYRDTARLVLPSQAVARCGRFLVDNPRNRHPGKVLIRVADRRAHLSGLVTCGSVWTCPVCAARIAEGRRDDVARALAGHYSVGAGVAYMGACTVPHTAFQSCVDLKGAVAEAWRKVQSGQPWVRAKARAGLVGTVRALEVTHGGNGWHPHLHVLFFLRRDDPEAAAAFGRWLFERWATIIGRMGLGKPTLSAWRFERARDPVQAGDYVAKWGADRELTGGGYKKAKGGRSPWEILADIGEYEQADDIALFVEYAGAFKGARQLTWSRGLRELYIVDPEPEDVDLAAAEPERAATVAVLSERGFEEIRDRGLVPALLGYVERDGGRGVIAFCAEHDVLLACFSLIDFGGRGRGN